MALSVVVPNTSIADLSSAYSSGYIKYAKLTGDTSYPQGAGYAVTPGTFGFSNTIITVQVVNPVGTVYYPWYDASNKSIRFLIAGNVTASEVATATNLSAVSLDVAVWGY